MSLIGRYSVVRKLATGGMAEVYLARVEGLSGFRKRVVVKRILPQLAQVPEFLEMFLKEARLAALLEHPNLAAVFDLGEEAGSYHLVMEYVEGTSLLGLIQAAQARREFLPFDRVAWIAIQVLEGLSYAHTLADEHGVPLQMIHRDVSPENVLLGRCGSVKLADFGLAKAANHPRITQTGAFKGKLHYLAPEMVHTSHFDFRVDLFSAGVLLFEAATNLKPFSGPTPNDILDAVLHKPAPAMALLRAGVPPLLQQIVDRALAKDPKDRYADARAMQRDLDRLLVELRARPAPSDLAALLEHFRPGAEAMENEPTPTDDRVGDTHPAPRASGTSSSGPDPKTTEISPFEPIPSRLPPRPDTPISGSETVRGVPAFVPSSQGQERTLIRATPSSPGPRTELEVKRPDTVVEPEASTPKPPPRKR